MNHSYDGILLLDSLKLDMEFFMTAFLQSGQSDPPFRSDRLHVSIEDLSAKFSPQKYVLTPSTAMLSTVDECGSQGWNLKVASTDRTLRKVGIPDTVVSWKYTYSCVAALHAACQGKEQALISNRSAKWWGSAQSVTP